MCFYSVLFAQKSLLSLKWLIVNSQTKIYCAPRLSPPPINKTENPAHHTEMFVKSSEQWKIYHLKTHFWYNSAENGMVIALYLYEMVAQPYCARMKENRRKNPICDFLVLIACLKQIRL